MAVSTCRVLISVLSTDDTTPYHSKIKNGRQAEETIRRKAKGKESKQAMKERGEGGTEGRKEAKIKQTVKKTDINGKIGKNEKEIETTKSQGRM